MEMLHQAVLALVEKQNENQAAHMANRAMLVALAALHGLNPDDGPARLEYLRRIALDAFSLPLDPSKGRTKYDDLAVAMVNALIDQVDQSVKLLAQTNRAN